MRQAERGAAGQSHTDLWAFGGRLGGRLGGRAGLAEASRYQACQQRGNKDETMEVHMSVGSSHANAKPR